MGIPAGLVHMGVCGFPGFGPIPGKSLHLQTISPGLRAHGQKPNDLVSHFPYTADAGADGGRWCSEPWQRERGHSLPLPRKQIIPRRRISANGVLHHRFAHPLVVNTAAAYADYSTHRNTQPPSFPGDGDPAGWPTLSLSLLQPSQPSQPSPGPRAQLRRLCVPQQHPHP